MPAASIWDCISPGNVWVIRQFSDHSKDAQLTPDPLHTPSSSRELLKGGMSFLISLLNSTSEIAECITHSPSAFSMSERSSELQIPRDLSIWVIFFFLWSRGVMSCKPVGVFHNEEKAGIHQLSLNNISLLTNGKCSRRWRVYITHILTLLGMLFLRISWISKQALKTSRLCWVVWDISVPPPWLLLILLLPPGLVLLPLLLTPSLCLVLPLWGP